jgi:hypothetical protein
LIFKSFVTLITPRWRCVLYRFHYALVFEQFWICRVMTKIRSIALYVFLLALAANAQAADLKPGELPSYAKGIRNVAIGSDGYLYAVDANPSGYVFKSLLDKYGFSVAGDGFGTEVLAGKEVYYLGKSCDAANGTSHGFWTKDGTGLFFAVELANAQAVTFRVLETGIEPSHSC